MCLLSIALHAEPRCVLVLVSRGPGRAAAAVAADVTPQEVDGWRQRMQEQYGLDTSVFRYDTENQQAAPAQRTGRGCSIM